MKVATFLVGVLSSYFDDRTKEAERIAKRWRAEYDELQEMLPDPAARTVEDWEKLVELTGELYYSMAAHSNTRAAKDRLIELGEALKEAVK